MCLGVPGKLVETFGRDDLPMGKVAFGGIVKEACLAYTPEAQVGDYVLVHVGFAISRIDEAEAEEIFGYLEQIAERNGAVQGGARVSSWSSGLAKQSRLLEVPTPEPRAPAPMKYLDEYRDAEAVRRLAAAIRAVTTRPWNIMEVCGGQTHAVVRFGLDDLLPPQITLIHGPGCPVCVTPVEIIDQATVIAGRPGVIFCSFGDMLRVPGSQKDLLTVKSEGGDVRIVYSPMDAVELAQKHPDRQVVFFAVGFETTAPANAMAVAQAAKLGLENFSVLVSHVLAPPAMQAVLDSPSNRVQGFLAAGHVSTITGIGPYLPIAEKYRVPIVITGFEPVDILRGVLACATQLEQGRHEVENQYARSVRDQGNLAALRQMAGSVRDRAAEVARDGRDSRKAALPCARSTRSSTPPSGSTLSILRPKNRPSASPAKSCKATRCPSIARPSASAARPSGRWGPRWFRRRGRVRRIIDIGGEGARDWDWGWGLGAGARD